MQEYQKTILNFLESSGEFKLPYVKSHFSKEYLEKIEATAHEMLQTGINPIDIINKWFIK